MSTESIQQFLERLEREKQEHLDAIEHHKSAIKEIESIIPGIKTRLGFHATQDSPRPHVVVAEGMFAGLSLRMALLKYLAMAQRGRAAVLTKVLIDGGFQTTEANLASNVSATLSAMRSKRHEVDREGDEWVITQEGRAEAIRSGFQSWV